MVDALIDVLPPPRELDNCGGTCWFLRTVSDRLWVVPSEQASHPQELTLRASARRRTTFYYIYQGTYGLPGAPPAVYVLDAWANQQPGPDYCLRQHTATTEALTWTECPQPPECGASDCSEWGLEAVDAPDGGFFLRASSCVGANCTFVGSTQSNAGLLSMTALANASRFESVCTVCPGAALGASGTLLCVVLAIIALLPTMRYAIRRRSLGRAVRIIHRQGPGTTSSWPRRERSLASRAAFQLGWVLTVWGMTPTLLWYIGNWWTGNASEFFGLVPLGRTSGS